MTTGTITAMPTGIRTPMDDVRHSGIGLALTDPLALQRLFAWFSPAFPVGAFAYSAGLETAISDGSVRTPAALSEWLRAILRHGAPTTDAILIAEAHRAAMDGEALAKLAELALALIPSPERRAETLSLGTSFRAAAAAWPETSGAVLPSECPYPVALGAIAGLSDLPLAAVLTGFLTALTQGQISVAVRLVPLGQTDGLRVLHGLEADIAAAAQKGETSDLDDLGAIGFAADIAAMAHETLNVRIFRS